MEPMNEFMVVAMLMITALGVVGLFIMGKVLTKLGEILETMESMNLQPRIERESTLGDIPPPPPPAKIRSVRGASDMRP